MRYAKPQVEEMGQANDLITVIYTCGPDFEASTGKYCYIDPEGGQLKNELILVPRRRGGRRPLGESE